MKRHLLKSGFDNRQFYLKAKKIVKILHCLGTTLVDLLDLANVGPSVEKTA